jgi:hypothetical protein
VADDAMWTSWCRSGDDIGVDGDGVVGSSPRYSAFGIRPRNRVCGEHCGHDEHWFLCPGVPPFCIVLHKRGSLPQEWQAPPIRARVGVFPCHGLPSPTWGDHLPYK